MLTLCAIVIFLLLFFIHHHCRASMHSRVSILVPTSIGSRSPSSGNYGCHCFGLVTLAAVLSCCQCCIVMMPSSILSWMYISLCSTRSLLFYCYCTALSQRIMHLQCAILHSCTAELLICVFLFLLAPSMSFSSSQVLRIRFICMLSSCPRARSHAVHRLKKRKTPTPFQPLAIGICDRQAAMKKAGGTKDSNLPTLRLLSFTSTFTPHTSSRNIEGRLASYQPLLEDSLLSSSSSSQSS